ncbi:MAG: ATP-dependent RNA helicase DbpA [Lentisphaeria bacterium]
MGCFTSLKLSAQLLKTVKELNYHEMTPVQEASVPKILVGEDLIVQAKTGSGKTAAFGLGILEKIDLGFLGVQALVLCPTRELADQVASELRRLAKNLANTRVVTLGGGVEMRPQVEALRHGAHIIVATPGRVLKHLDRGTLDFRDLKFLVLDEADRLLEMGFAEDLRAIEESLPKNRQTLLFSATFPAGVAKISRDYLINPTQVMIDTVHNHEAINQIFYQTSGGNKIKALLKILSFYKPESAVVFCNTKQMCEDIADRLYSEGFYVDAIHGDVDQYERNDIMLRFVNKSISILVATDVAARGLDVKDLSTVISLELPTNPDTHVHRIGRTGRAGASGIAINIFTANEQYRVDRIAEEMNIVIETKMASDLPEYEPFELIPPMRTVEFNGGKKQKIRPGDILGALIQEAGLKMEEVGKITVQETRAYVAILRSAYPKVESWARNGKVKGRTIKL